MDPLLTGLLQALLLGAAVGALLVEGLSSWRRRGRQVRAAERHAMLAEFRYALSDDLEKAVEEITGRVKADGPGGVETWFALGSLLRRKGDHLRAIRIHEDLIGNGRLHPSVRRAAAYELALDFRRAGMHGRAAETLEALLAQDPGHREALRELREIAEEEGDWQRAIDAQQKLEARGEAESSILAHLHAAHARRLLADGQVQAALQAAEEGVRAGPESADAMEAHASALAAAGEREAAEARLAQALERCPDLAASTSFDGLRDSTAMLRGLLDLHPDHPWLRLALARSLRRAGAVDEAATILRDLLAEGPAPAEAGQELAETLLAGGGSTSALREELRALLPDLGTPARPFGCTHCGMEVAAFGFRCARCFSWDTIRALPSGRIAPDRRTGS